MSQAGDPASSPEQVGVRLKEPELLDALGDAEDEYGSRSEALRAAIRTAYVDGDDADGDVDGGLSQKAERGLLALKENTGPRSMIELGVAKSIVANECNIKAEHCRFQVFEPLRRAEKIAVMQGIQSTSIEVLDDGE